MTKNPEDDLNQLPIVLGLEASEISEIRQLRFMAEIQGVVQRAAEVKLPARFKADGFDRELAERDGDLAIYRQSRNGRLVSCEVIRIRHLPARRLPDGALARPTEKSPHRQAGALMAGVARRWNGLQKGSMHFAGA